MPRLERDYDVRSIGLFGSCLKGTQSKGSDIDILIEYEKIPGMFKYLDLENELSELLGCKVDLVLKSALKPSIGARILQEVQNV
jgi:predicted nucleotidyltransferase